MGASPASIRWTSAAGSAAVTSRAGYSRRIDSSRSAPKRKTERAKQEISSPWRRVSQSTVASVPASKEPATSTTCGESPGTAASSESCDGGERGGVHARRPRRRR